MATELAPAPEATALVGQIRVAVPERGLRHDLRAITQKVRPDWDLGAPGMREAWERGEKGNFWPYGRPFKEVLAEAS